MTHLRRYLYFSPLLFLAACLVLVSVCRVSAVWAQAMLENPAPNSSQSGLGVISGWACEAGRIEIEFNGDVRTRSQAGYGTARGDTAGVCGDTDNGFGLLFNWNLLGDGEHTVRALADGQEFARVTATVTTLGQEFAQGVSREVPVADFPGSGEQRTLVWQESQQNFVITAGQPSRSGGTRGQPPRVLENPPPGSYQSGIGLLSGWVCEANRVEIELSGGQRIAAAYGTERADTAAACGDTNNGFGLLFNWNLLGDGTHTVRALADGQEFARSTVTVTTLGQEFARLPSREVTVADFPEVGDETTLAWQPAKQNFVITGSTAGGPVLSIAAPDPVPGFFAAVTGILRPVVRYTGEAPLSFALTTAPPGMVINARSGTIAWTPPASATSRTFDVTVEVKSKELLDSVEFQVSVLRTTPVQTTVANGELMVTDGETDLHGLSITTPETRLSLSDLRLETVERDAVLATVPAGLILLSDFFVIREPFVQPVELTFPVGDLPESTTIQDVDLYTFSKATDGAGPFWGPVLVDWGYELVNGEPAYIVSLEGLQGLFAFGLREFVPGGRATSRAAPVGDGRIVTPAVSRRFAAAQTSSATQTIADKVDCSPLPLSHPALVLDSLYRDQTCTYSDDSDVVIRVKDFGWLPDSTQWEVQSEGKVIEKGIQIEEFVARVIAVQKELEKLGFTYDKNITVDFDYPLALELDLTGETKLGSVYCNLRDRAKTLSIYPDNINASNNPYNLPLADLATETIAHEYFHHAQCHEKNKIPGLDLAIYEAAHFPFITDIPSLLWLIEGTADWFAHRAIPASRSIRVDILEVGLNAIPDDDDKVRTSPYRRAPFFDMLEERCIEIHFLLKRLLSIDKANDPSGINRLAEVLLLEDSRCDFGDLGPFLSAALADFQIATLNEDRKPGGGNAFGYAVDAIRPYERSYVKLHFDQRNPRSFPIPLPAVSATTLVVHLIGSDQDPFAARDIVEVSISSNALVDLSNETCTENVDTKQRECTVRRPPESIRSARWRLRAPSTNEEGRLYATLVNPDLEKAAEVDVTVRLVSGPAVELTGDRAALTALHHATRGANWRNKTNWLSDAPLSQWYGVATDDTGRVAQLNLSGNQLGGTIPTALSELSNLELLDLSKNQLSGTIPADLSRLSDLLVLNLSENRLSGTIPAGLGSLSNLLVLVLFDNQLSRTIPAELGSLSDLVLLDLSNNRLAGPIPAELGSLSDLEGLYLLNNRLSGAIPPELSRLSKLQGLYLAGNQLTGCIPDGLRGVRENDLSSLGLQFCPPDDKKVEPPEMVVIPGGSFRMGCLNDDGDCSIDEFPAHRVSVPRFALSKYEVTFAEWDACVAAGGCNGYEPDDEDWGRGNRPVANVSWDDAQSYVAWLSAQTGDDYRLPSEAEWEYAARAGTTTKYHWGNSVGRNRANCDGCGSRWDDEQPAPVGQFAPNAWGLYDMHGNVWEWVQDCEGDYEDTPRDGSAWESGGCDDRVLRGGSWDLRPRVIRSAYRYEATADVRDFDFGFRIARSLP